jgi:hypothetical protein
MTKETSSKTYLKQSNIGTCPSDDLAELQSSSTETSIRNTTNNERHMDYELKAANKTFRSTRQDENNSTSDTNNKETFNPKPLSLNEGPRHFLEDIFKHLNIDEQQERTRPVPSSRPQGFRDHRCQARVQKNTKSKQQLRRERQRSKQPLKTKEQNCNVRGRGALSHYLVYSESPSRWCSLAIILLVYLHHNLLLASCDAA